MGKYSCHPNESRLSRETTLTRSHAHGEPHDARVHGPQVLGHESSKAAAVVIGRHALVILVVIMHLQDEPALSLSNGDSNIGRVGLPVLIPDSPPAEETLAAGGHARAGRNNLMVIQVRIVKLLS